MEKYTCCKCKETFPTDRELIHHASHTCLTINENTFTSIEKAIMYYINTSNVDLSNQDEEFKNKLYNISKNMLNTALGGGRNIQITPKNKE